MRDDVIPYLEKEKRLLPELEQALSVPVPHFTCIGQGDESYPYTFVGYPKIGGVALEEEGITRIQLATLAPALAAFPQRVAQLPA